MEESNTDKLLNNSEHLSDENMVPAGIRYRRFTGVAVVIVGALLVLIGFYIMANGMLLNSAGEDTEATMEQLKTLRYLSAGGMYVMVYGGYSMFAGFVEAVNAANVEFAKKGIIYGLCLLVLAVVNTVALAILGETKMSMSAFIIVYSFAVAILYIVGQVILKRIAVRRA